MVVYGPLKVGGVYVCSGYWGGGGDRSLYLGDVCEVDVEARIRQDMTMEV